MIPIPRRAIGMLPRMSDLCSRRLAYVVLMYQDRDAAYLDIVPRQGIFGLMCVGGFASSLELANSFALALTVAHYPRGASKWYAQNPKLSGSQMDTNVVAGEVVETERRLAAAYAQSNVADFDLLVLDDCLIADEGRVRTKPEERKYVARSTDVNVSLSFQSSTTRVHDECVIVIGHLTETVDSGGQAPQKSAFLISDVFLRRGGAWKLASRHQTRLPDARQEIVLERPDLLGRNAGDYIFESGMRLEVFLKDNKLYARIVGGEEQHLRPISTNEFFVTAFDAEITFIPDAQGQLNTIMLRQGGKVLFAHRH